MNNYLVYVITNTVNNKLYFGITKVSLVKRWNQHVCNSTRKNYHLYNAMREYGVENFRIDLMKACNTEIEMYDLEKWLIKIFDTTNPLYGYNNSIGGESSTLGSKRSEDTIRKISLSQKGKKRKPFSQEARKNQSIAAKGRDMSKQIKSSVSKRKGMPAHNRRPVISIDKSGAMCYYDSILNASNQTRISMSSISNNLKGRSKTAGGLKWQYQNVN